MQTKQTDDEPLSMLLCFSVVLACFAQIAAVADLLDDFSHHRLTRPVVVETPARVAAVENRTRP